MEFISSISFFFFLTIAGLALSLSALGLDFTTALTGAAKWLLCVGMLMGRLEILTVLVLLTPMFWRK